MKKLFAAILITAMLLSLTGCFESIPAEEVSGFSLPDDITSETVNYFEVVAYPFQYQF